MDRKIRTMFLLFLTLSGSLALAEDGAAVPDDDPEPQALERLRPGRSPSVAPQRGPVHQDASGPQVEVDPSVIGLPPGEALPRARREGAFVVNQPGRVLRPDDASQWIFQPMGAEDEASELPPMLVLPSARLEMMETYMQEQGGEAWFEVSGRVHAYHGVNYLLLTQARPQVNTSDAESAAEAEADEPTSSLDEAEDPLLQALLEQRQAAPAGSPEQPAERPRDRADVVAGSAPRSASAADPPVRDEGSVLVQRRGRVMHARDGSHVLFVLEADGPESPEPPLILQPCRLLETMERIVQQRGDQVLFVVSGQVQRYRGANYLLPTMMRVVPDKGNLGR